MDLNPAQHEAVTTIDGPLLILAGPGSGKTFVLENRISYMKEKKIPSSSLLAITFSRKAAEEMKERITKRVGHQYASNLWMSTFHALCSHILRKHTKFLTFLPFKLSRDFTIYTKENSIKLLKTILKNFSIDSKQYPINTIYTMISLLKNELITPSALEQNQPPNPYIDRENTKNITNEAKRLLPKQKFIDLYKAYQNELNRNNALDFGDLLVFTIHLFQYHPRILEQYQKRYRYIMVDEYQDTNRAQYALISLLAKAHRNIAVVGDDFQSIYRFRGGDIRNILYFDKEFPDAKTVKLEENYRCTSSILSAATQIISHNSNQRKKNLFTMKEVDSKIQYYCGTTEYSEAKYIRNQILSYIKMGYEFHDVAVLFRTNNQAKPIEDVFKDASIPYRVAGGTRFFDKMEIQDIMAYLRFLKNPSDLQSFSRIVNTPKRGIGKDVIESILELARNDLGDILHVLDSLDLVSFSSRSQKGLKNFIQLIHDLKKASSTMSCGHFLSYFLIRSGYLPYITSYKNEKTTDRLKSVSELLSIAIEFENHSAKGTFFSFLQHLEDHLEFDEKTYPNSVRLMSIHASKGLEFPIVFICGMEEKIFPHMHSKSKEEIEEERRICFVAFTRAISHLHLTRTEVRIAWGQPSYNEPSRFLYEFNQSLLREHTPLPPDPKQFY